MIFGLLWILTGCATKSVSGMITTPEMVPLANAKCTFLEQTVVTDENGSFQFQGLSLSKGEYSLMCTRSGFEFVQEQFNVAGTQFVTPSLIMKPISVEIPYPELNLDPEGSLK